MAEDFVELGIEGFDRVTGKWFDKTYDKIDKPESDKSSRNKDRMSNQQRYPPSPPVHRGYDDDRYNEYDDEEPRGSRKYKESRDRDRYNPADWQQQPRQYDQPRYPNDRASRYNDNDARPSSRDNAAPYAAAGVAGGAAAAQGGALAQYPKKRYDYDDRRGHSSSRSRSSSRDRDYDRDRDRRRDRDRDRDRHRDRDGSGSGNHFSDSPALAFDKSDLGLGAGLAGAVVGGWLGREVGDHRKRASALGAIVGGIGANLLEHRWRIYQDEKKEQERAADEKWGRRQQGVGGGGGTEDGRRRGRSR